MSDTKECRLCTHTHPVTEFYKTATRGYLSPYCKTCYGIFSRESRRRRLARESQEGMLGFLREQMGVEDTRPKKRVGDTKRCYRCETYLPLTAFSRLSKSKDGLRQDCRECHGAQYDYFARSVRQFGLSREEHAAMLSSQGGACAICRVIPSGNLAIDHCHTTGDVRGLLCANCNLGIGNLRDSPANLRAAADYLERHATPVLRLA